jgi:hypothetical protein
MIKRLLDYKNNERVIFINKYKKYNTLILSSSSFLLPSYYAYINNFYGLSIISLLVSIISSGHWYRTSNFTLRIMDLIMAKVGFGIYFTLLILNTKVRMKEILLLNMMILFYFLSNNRITNKKEDWVYYHMIFHIFVTIDQMMTIKGLLDN